MTKNAVRLLAGLRLSCFTAEGFADAKRVLIERFLAECARDGRDVPPFEVPNAFAWAADRVAGMPEAELPSQIGSTARPHTHDTIDLFAYAAEKRTASPPAEVPEAAAAGDRAEITIRLRVEALRIEHEARRRFDEATRPPVEYPPVRSLAELLAEPDCDTAYRIEGLAPTEARVMLSAQFKAGKTTLVGNLIQSFADGSPFLGRFAVNTPARRMALIDDELSEHTLRRWLRAQNITNTGAVADVVALRGKVSAFNLLDDRCRSAWAQRFRELGVDYLMFDCLRPVMDALGLDENRDAGRFLVAFDALLAEAGIGDALMVQHMGHSNERARGDSRLQDWPDAIWRLVRENEDPNSPRYFTAYGRDVDVPEGRLDFDPVTRRLSFADGSSRKAAKSDESAAEALHAVITVLVDHALKNGAEVGMKVREVKDAVAVHKIGNRRVAGALEKGLIDGVLSSREGERQAVLYTLSNPCGRCFLPVAESSRGFHRECEV